MTHGPDTTAKRAEDLDAMARRSIDAGDFAAARAAFEEALSYNPHMESVKRALEEIESEERPI